MHIDHSIKVSVRLQSVDAEFELTERLQPYALTNAMCLVTISHWAIDAAYNLAEMDFVFEHGLFGQGDFKRSWRESIVKDLMPDPIIKERDDHYPQVDALNPIRPFEAADLIAYEVSKTAISTQRHLD